VTDNELALFPLGTVLMPGGRLSLQIFEQRYLSLIRNALKAELQFGIVMLTGGGEVDRAGGNTCFAKVGVSAKIVDWDKLQNGLLGIVVEGQRRFFITDLSQQADGLWQGVAEFWPDEPRITLPEDRSDWTALLQQLADHPHVKRLGFKVETEDASLLSYQLAQLLPIPERERYDLLVITDPLDRLDAIHELLSQYED
jgi:Lon protease-like protein